MAGNILTLWCLTVVSVLLTVANGHGFLTIPQPRGLLLGHNLTPWLAPFPGISRECRDWAAHFPAGDKAQWPGAGLQSQRNALRTQGGKWSVFKPMEWNFKWRAGVCGDNYGVNPQEHMRGGKYYCDAFRSATYTQGQVIDVTMTMVAHHNGYMELHACDVSRCGGEISENCFRQKHCKQLRRAPNGNCDHGWNKNCGPIDRNYPARWYVPCSDGTSSQRMGGQWAKFKLPDDMYGDHIVLHWFHTAANGCNQVGVLEYFDGPDRPKNWGQCPGQGGARGGVTRNKPACDVANDIPEEYYACADLRILPRSGAPVQTAPPPPPRPVPVTPTPSPSPRPKTAASNSGPFVNFILFGKRGTTWSEIRPLYNWNAVYIGGYDAIAIEARTTGWVKNVMFYINGGRWWTEWATPYFFGGDRNGHPHGWNHPIVNRYFEIKAVSGTDWSSYKINIKLLR